MGRDQGNSGPPAAPLLGPRHAWRTALVLRTCRQRMAGAGPILDAGCGPGSTALGLARAGRTVLALDLAVARLRQTRERARQAGLRAQVLVLRADLLALPLADRTLAGAVAGEVIEHLADDGAALEDLARVMAPGAVLVLTVPAGPRRLGPRDQAAGHWRRYDRAGLNHLLGSAGLEVVDLRGWGWPLGRLYDRFVQGPALATSGRVRRNWLARWGRQAWLLALGRWIFDLEARLDAGEHGSGWLAVARKPGDGRAR